jgi:dihydroxy-acid dehydratase
VLHAISGSTNAILHLIAYAGRVEVDLPLQLFDELCSSTPWLVNLKPAGEHLMEDFFEAGGLPAVMSEISDLLHLDAITVTGATVGENIDGARVLDTAVIRTAAEPLDEGGALVVLNGSLCPDGAVMKISAADSMLLQHEGRAIVFDDIHDLAARVDDPELDCDETSVMVLRNAGPVGAPGMPEWGHLPIPAKLLKQGVTDLLRISDARMSGTRTVQSCCT